MISDCLDCADTRRWKHGLLYTDGTTRDAAAIAAVRGIYLNRGDTVPLAVPRPDVEHKPSTLAKAAAAWLQAAAVSEPEPRAAAGASCKQEPSDVFASTNIHGGALGIRLAQTNASSQPA